MTAISLEFGTHGCWEGEVARERLIEHRSGPPSLSQPRESIAECLESPIDFPPLRQAVVPGDKIVITLDRGVPSAPDIIAETWKVFESVGISPDSISILQPAVLSGEKAIDPRDLLPHPVREAMAWKTHDPTADQSTGYLASSAGGERIYLAREILEADFVLPVSRLGYDPLLGRRQALGSFYPGFSTTEAFAKTRGQGHSELGPDEERPIRQLIGELSWLLGIQFVIQVLPSSHGRGAARFLAGHPDSVARDGESLLDENWRISLLQRGETVLVSVPTSRGETSDWEQLGAALEAARNAVVRDGRIIVLTDLAAKPTQGIEMIRAHASAKSALKPLRTESPPDVIAATQIASAASWAGVYLLSELPSQLVEELFMTPLEHPKEVTRLLGLCDSLITIAGAQYAFTELAG